MIFKCGVIKKIVCVPIVVFVVLTPLTVNVIPAFPPSLPPDDDYDYSLDYAGGGGFWDDTNNFKDLTYFSFYTFFKSGIEPDCIDMVESKEESCCNDLQM